MKRSILSIVFLLALSLVGEVLAQNPKSKASTKGAASGAKAEKKDGEGSSVFSGLTKDSEKGDLPVYIRSETVSLDAKKRVFTYQGNVEVTRGEIIITSDTINGTYDGNNKLEQIVFERNVVLTKGEALRATANRAVYRVKQDTVEMTQAPEVIEGGNALTADKITVYLKEDRSEAEGNVRVKFIKSEDSQLDFGKSKNTNKSDSEEIGKKE